MVDLCPEIRVIAMDEAGQRRIMGLRDLLPMAYVGPVLAYIHKEEIE